MSANAKNEREEDAYFELSFSPNVTLVSTVRRFVSEFYVQVLGDAEMTSRLAIATHELLENAVRYSCDGHSSIRIGVTTSPSNEIEIVIDTRNRASRDNLASLQSAVEEMTAATDAALHYQTLMRRTAKRTDGSGLGLGRIRAETDMEISYRIEDDMALLRAQARFAKGASTT